MACVTQRVRVDDPFWPYNLCICERQTVIGDTGWNGDPEKGVSRWPLR